MARFSSCSATTLGGQRGFAQQSSLCGHNVYNSLSVGNGRKGGGKRKEKGCISKRREMGGRRNIFNEIHRTPSRVRMSDFRSRGDIGTRTISHIRSRSLSFFPSLSPSLSLAPPLHFPTRRNKHLLERSSTLYTKNNIQERETVPPPKQWLTRRNWDIKKHE